MDIILREYYKQLEKSDFTEDQAQIAIINELDGVLWGLVGKNPSLLNMQATYGDISPLQKGRTDSPFHKGGRRFSARGFFAFLQPKQKIQGLYLFGPVGRGKSFLINLFIKAYQDLGYQNLYHTHFHSFMQFVHNNLKEYQGTKNPLEKIIKNFAKKYKILCLDEFMVTDITDAMLLANLLEQLNKNNIILITTSNIKPDDLYKNGLQRSQFLPAIELLKNNNKVVELLSPQDYRLRNLENSEVFYFNDHCKCEELFNKFAVLNINFNQSILINDRKIKTNGFSDKVLWVDFHEICETNRAVKDYIEIAQIYNIVIISDVPKMSDQNLASIRRFVNLIDELYLYKVKLVANFAVNIDELYKDDSLNLEFERTKSRLIEMQSQYYLKLPHGVE